MQPMRGLQAKSVDVGNEEKQPGKFLSALHDTELGGLLDRVVRVAAGIGKPDDLCFRGLRLRQEEGEIRGHQRRPHRA